MFTGLIETTGSVSDLRKRGDYTEITITSRIDSDSLKIGESIACDGACLTVTDKSTGKFTVTASPETLGRTVIGSYKVGTRLNLERALIVGDRFGGHLVTGHIDTTGVIERFVERGDSFELSVGYGHEFDRMVIEKGSIAINGISLTVNQTDPGRLIVNLIPHTVKETCASLFKAGGAVNLEFDLIGKYVLNLLEPIRPKGVTREKLKESGW